MSDTSPATEGQTSLFRVCYEIGSNEPGAPLLSVNLLVDAPAGIVSGKGRVSQAIYPPLDITTEFKGVETGPGGIMMLKGTDSSGEPNVLVQISLQNGWETGTASFEYKDHSGNWHVVVDVPVHSVPCA